MLGSLDLCDGGFGEGVMCCAVLIHSSELLGLGKQVVHRTEKRGGCCASFGSPGRSLLRDDRGNFTVYSTAGPKYTMTSSFDLQHYCRDISSEF